MPWLFHLRDIHLARAADIIAPLHVCVRDQVTHGLAVFVRHIADIYNHH